MPSPFPGMDPYLERADIWPDFHDSLITCIRGALQSRLRPRYCALTQEHLYVVESKRPIPPDVSIIRSPRPASGGRGRARQRAGGQPPANGGGVAVAEAAGEFEAPAVYELQREEYREPLIHIIEPAAGNRIVTAIEVLSPSNKDSGAGREHYLRKREELWSGGANIVELDLLRGGELTVGASAEQMEAQRPWHFMAAVSRREPPQLELYAMTFQRRLRDISIPLASGDRDVKLDLQAAFTRCWDEGPYPDLLRYDSAPPGTLPLQETEWCRQLASGPARPSRNRNTTP